MGKYHPHGDSSIYEAMVRMAQDFSTRYPLIDGHGNFGTTDDGPAAPRYTEARIAKFGEEMLKDIEKNTVAMIDNYDGTEQEPEVLPSAIPNFLANGTSGIAVGMATNVPPHNLRELIKAIKILAHNPECTIEEIAEVLQGPDFPTYGEIIGLDGISNYFHTGKGSVIMRAKCEISVNEHSNKAIIIVKELPYLVSKKALIEKITDLVKEKQIDGISDLQDYSSKEGTHIEIILKKDTVPEVLLNQLFKSTQLQIAFPVNMLAIVHGEPKLMNIKEALEVFMEHQFDVLNRRLNFDLTKIKEREHILEGLHKATSDIDQVIAIIRNAEDSNQAQTALMEKFQIDEVQSKAILDMKLRSLSGLERKKIEDELEELKAKIINITSILADRTLQIKEIEDQLDVIDKKYGDERRTVIRTDIASSIDNEDLIPKSDIIITLSKKAYIKRLPIDAYKAQKRGGTGVTGAVTHEDDNVEKIVTANTHTDLLLFSNLGKVYRLRGHQIPLCNKTSKGIPVINILPKLEKTETIITILPIDEYTGSLFFCSKNAIIKRTNLKEFENINSNGKIALGLKENDQLFNVIKINEGNEISDQIYIGLSNGNLVRFYAKEIREMGRTAAGVIGAKLESKDEVVGLSSSLQGDKILSIGTKGVGKISYVDNPENLEEHIYRITKHGAKGVRAMKVTPKTGKLIFTSAVNGDEEALMISSKGIVIRFLLSQVSIIGKNSQGVRLMNIPENEKLQSVTMFKKGMLEEADDNLEEEQVSKTQLIDLDEEDDGKEE
jgi:DNA gyrase subunit A